MVDLVLPDGLGVNHLMVLREDNNDVRVRTSEIAADLVTFSSPAEESSEQIKEMLARHEAEREEEMDTLDWHMVCGYRMD